MNLQSPTQMLLAWVVFPCLVLLISAGVGVLCDRVTARDLSVLTLPTGFAASIVAFCFILQLGVPASASSAIIGLTAIVGLGMAIKDRAGVTPDSRALVVCALIAAGVAYLIGIAPLIGSGRLGVLGYVILNDPAWHLSLIEWIHANGMTPATVLDSANASISQQLGQGYPIGSYSWQLIAKSLLGIRPMFIWTPTAAITLSMIAMVAYAAVIKSGATRRWAVVLAAAIGVGFLPLSYLAQGGVKEVTFAFTFSFAATAIAGLEFRADERTSLALRRTFAAAVGIAAMIAVFGPAAGLWIAPLVLIAVIVAAVTRPAGLPFGRLALLVSGWGAITIAITLPSLIDALRVFSTVSTVAGGNDIGNLLGPVPFREVFNVWISPDYRFADPHEGSAAWIAIVTTAAALLAVIGIVTEARARRLFVPLASTSGFLAILYISSKYNIYFIAKSYVAFAPVVGCATAAGLIWLITSQVHRRRYAGIAIAGALALTIVVSIGLYYGSVFMTPGERFEELAEINERLDGHGPTLVNEREEYARVLLRDNRPWESFGLFVPDRGFRPGGGYPMPITPDVDSYRDDHMKRFVAIVERKHPGASRPPSNYARWFETSRYVVWRRQAPQPQAHVAIGLASPTGAGPLDCNLPDVQLVARAAREQGKALLIATPQREKKIVFAEDFKTNADWRPPSELGIRTREHNGSGEFEVKLTAGKTYRPYLQGSLGRGVDVYVDDRKLATARDDLGTQDQWQPLPEILGSGATKVRLEPAATRFWRAGNLRHDDIRAMAFVEDGPDSKMREITPAQLLGYCGKQVDWVELPAR